MNEQRKSHEKPRATAQAIRKKPKNIYGAALWTSLFSLVMCIAMLSGTTYAWFSETVTNKNNRIQAGEFRLNVVGYNTANGMAVTDGDGPIVFSNEEDHRMLIDEIMKAGDSNVKYIAISNTGTLDFKYRLSFALPESDQKLEDVLWYKLAKVGDLNVGFGANVEEKSMADIDDAESAIVDVLNENIRQHIYRLEYGMRSTAGTTYLNETFKLDIMVEAYQTETPTEQWTEEPPESPVVPTP